MSSLPCARPPSQVVVPTTATGLALVTFAQMERRGRGRPPRMQLLNTPGAVQSMATEESQAQRHRFESESGGLPQGQPMEPAVGFLTSSNSGSHSSNRGSQELEESQHQNNNDGTEDADEDGFLEQQALRTQANWAHYGQDGTKVYAEPQKEYKLWCKDQNYPDQFVNEFRLLRFLQHLETRPMKMRGRKSLNEFQVWTTRKINGKVVLLEHRDKDGKVIFRHADYDSLVNQSSTTTLSHHTIKVYVNALVNLYFWQSVDTMDQNAKNPHPYPRGPSIKSFVRKHKEEHEKQKAARFDDPGLEDVSIRITNAKWMKLAMLLLKEKKFVELATLWTDKQVVGWHQLARDWCLKDMFLYTLENESVTGDPVQILVGRSKVSKTNHFERVEHFAFFRSKNVLECAWGWQVELMARGYTVGVDGRVWAAPDLSNRTIWFSVKVRHDPKYGSMYRAVDKALEEIGIHSKKKAHISRVKGNMDMFNESLNPEDMRVAARNKLDSQETCYKLSLSLPAGRVLAKWKKDQGSYNCVRERCEVPEALKKCAFVFLDNAKKKVADQVASGQYVTAIAETDYLEVMSHNQDMLFQDMAEKMDDESYMEAVGDNDAFIC
ncbi:hypothetical protein CcCBS67573_g08219 [Chytriomyces confervae]|uniref:Ndc10 domain-containing protein n=1 Tax=Chytriomyces confervae TaxID=246404 RepID=A0A507ELM0_9FUNG|nr:hypothetical protein CcCBS67573_g08219 [Chytriomyces confervae]